MCGWYVPFNALRPVCATRTLHGRRHESIGGRAFARQAVVLETVGSERYDIIIDINWYFSFSIRFIRLIKRVHRDKRDRQLFAPVRLRGGRDTPRRRCARSEACLAYGNFRYNNPTDRTIVLLRVPTGRWRKKMVAIIIPVGCDTIIFPVSPVRTIRPNNVKLGRRTLTNKILAQTKYTTKTMNRQEWTASSKSRRVYGFCAWSDT